MRPFAFFGAIAGAVAFGAAAWSMMQRDAPPVDTCDAVLVENIEYDTLSRDFQLAWLKTVTQSNFEEKRRKAGGTFNFKVIDPTTLVTQNFELGADWRTFQTRRSQLFQQEQYAESEDLAVARFRSIVPPEARAAWVECKKAFASNRNNYGFHVYVSNETEEAVTVTYVWNPLGNVRAGVDSQQLTGGKAIERGVREGELVPRRTTFEPGESHDIIIARTENKEVRGALKVGGVSKPFYVPPVHHPAYQVAVNIVPAAVQRAEVTKTFSSRVWPGRCANGNTERQDRFCLAADERPTEVESVSTAPIPNIPQAPDGCFLVSNPRLSPDAAPSCAVVKVTMKNCRVTLYQFSTPKGHACLRAMSQGTPFEAKMKGYKEEVLSLQPHREVSTFDGSRSFRYPTNTLPVGAVNVSYRFAVTVTELKTGTTVQLDNQHPRGGGFEVVTSEGGARVVVVRDRTQQVQAFNAL